MTANQNEITITDALESEGENSAQNSKIAKTKNRIEVSVLFDFDSITRISFYDFVLTKGETPSAVRVDITMKFSHGEYQLSLTNLKIWELAQYLKDANPNKKIKYNKGNIHINNTYTTKEEKCFLCGERSRIIFNCSDTNGRKTKIFFCKKCFESFRKALLKINGYINEEMIINKYSKIMKKNGELLTQFKAVSAKNKNYKDMLKRLNEEKQNPPDKINKNLLKENEQLKLRIKELESTPLLHNKRSVKANKMKDEFNKFNEMNSFVRNFIKEII